MGAAKQEQLNNHLMVSYWNPKVTRRHILSKRMKDALVAATTEVDYVSQKAKVGS